MYAAILPSQSLVATTSTTRSGGQNGMQLDVPKGKYIVPHFLNIRIWNDRNVSYGKCI